MEAGASKPDCRRPVARRGAVSPCSQSDFFSRSADFEKQLRNLPLVRPEKIREVEALAADEEYPPQDLLDRIAGLLAAHRKQLRP